MQLPGGSGRLKAGLCHARERVVATKAKAEEKDNAHHGEDD
jgi:hypothetical protein